MDSDPQLNGLANTDQGLPRPEVQSTSPNFATEAKNMSQSEGFQIALVKAQTSIEK